ncbi:hypothetical protein [Nocardioides sp. cx-169]|nr:hypothetical protein [Nocardioides sp. cx-169]
MTKNVLTEALSGRRRLRDLADDQASSKLIADGVDDYRQSWRR